MPDRASYQIRCDRCSAITTCSMAEDAVRTICPSCGAQLTLPGTLQAQCGFCRKTAEYPHALAGHGALCPFCGTSIVLPALPGRAGHYHAGGHHHRTPYKRHGRTLAFSDAAERTMILVAAALAALLLVLFISMR
jgi:hypothetical protein